MKHFKVKEEFLKKAPSTSYLYHQQRTLDELHKNEVVFNTYPTGAGKTIASLLYLKENRDDVLFIAPTNELLRQHSDDIKDFINKNNLPHIVVKVDASVIEKIRENHRKGSTLYELLNNPLQFKEELSINNIEYEGKRPVVIVVNPDIFYYCLYTNYNSLDKWNLMKTIIKKFKYIIVDEFHYYNSKQLANFLFFMLLSKEFGYFEYGRKMCILTATPDKLVEEYLTRGNIKYKIVSKENETEESINYEKLQTLSKLDLYITNEGLDEVINKIYKENKFEDDSVIISQSIYRVNRLKEELINRGIEKDNIGVITGAIKSEERKSSVKKPLILATPTVDIGYNFKKANKERQNIDVVLTEANTSDQALQRIGRAGRVLGKKIQNKRSKVILSVSDTIYNKFSEIQEEISRSELKDIIKECMPERNIMKKYVQSEGILELCFPIREMYIKMPLQLRYKIENIFDNIVKVFAPKSKCNLNYMLSKIKKYKEQCDFIREYNNSCEKEDLIKDSNNKWFVDFYKDYCREDDESIDDSILDDFSKEDINSLKLEFKEQLLHYINKEIAKVKCLMNFRGSDISKPALVFDPYYKFGQENQVFVYDIFHLIRYYDIEWCDSKAIWEKKSNIKLSKYEIEVNQIDKIDTFIIVNGIRESPIEISWEYGFLGTKDEFEDLYMNKVEAINNIVLLGYEYTKLGKERVYFPEKIINAFKENYIPILLVSSNPKEEYRLRKIIKNQPIFLQKLKVEFLQDEKEKEYFIIMGTNSIIVDNELVKIKDKVVKEDYFIH
ncbi:type I-D CRISPR-associated helicase Cas3' [Clostridium botulinum C]|uniref:type I-D CRISPR-associated helicase Cas3' n=1 Tax=Clostridium botulinum TaxID=1491 RepID=UPI001E432025|nr:type I-D CRISPR-associated helicase Cas3' [Clostridium botulinum]MCD3245457.1 type I-D CRISPR-associated helicase Cas3' [Clostridium botulinum C]MCD3261836.1 type I-D CRISPR-associated helicase Cas3' [Clostridium botulinum C]